MIRVEGITKVYRLGDIEVVALQGVSLQIDEGEFVSIMGPSGSGKTTFMNILGCLDLPTEGSYTLDGVLVSEMTDNELAYVRNHRLGFVFQTYNLLPRLDALANVELPLIYRGSSRRVRRTLSVKALQMVGLGDRLHHRPSELSGGQQQRVAVARALVTRPSMILADEPTGNLDSRSGEEIMAIFQALNEGGITVVLVTHDPDIARYGKRIVRFRDGRVVSDEAVRDRLLTERNDSLEAMISELKAGALQHGSREVKTR